MCGALRLIPSRPQNAKTVHAESIPIVPSDVDTITVIAFTIAAVSVGLAFFFLTRSRALSRSVDAARQRIGGNPPKRSWHRKGALDEALQRLERSSSQAQRERSQLAGALQATSLGIIITDDHGVVTFANQAADQYLGARQGEPIAEESLGDVIERAILKRIAISTEIERPTPVPRILDVSAVPLDFGVESVGAVTYIDDITDQRSVDVIRRDFISNVSHELRTPLSALAALSDTVADNLDDAETATRLASRLAAEASRLSVLVDNILELSQAEALASRDEAVEASVLTTSVADFMEQMAAERGIELVVEPAPPSARVSGDERQLRSMLLNLVDNALKFSTPSGDGAAPRVWLRTSLGENTVVFTVQDEGIGIPKSHVDRIFERFYRVDRDRGTATSGAGLGLSIARHVARNHGGDVVVTSKPGEGTLFSVTLPLWKE